MNEQKTATAEVLMAALLMQIESALKGELPILAENKITHGNGLPIHGMQLQERYECVTASTEESWSQVPIAQLKPKRADRIEEELFSMGIWYLNHWIQFQKVRAQHSCAQVPNGPGR